ncbi:MULTISPECIES: hypothetical protein [Pseudomonas syringae group]|uniref:hypothetical protein n=1 Tax=Pseudomonas syringae group TaxID=136849 RepID=UPI0006B95336|nr:MULTISPECIES: hypothetical protein [Pseudomonas syringae group]
MSEAQIEITANNKNGIADEGERGDCALCDSKNIILKESHSVPKFVFDWLKITSATPYIRCSDDVNIRHQDGPKEYLLCGNCEGTLSTLEKELAEQLFKKIANYRQQSPVIVVTETMQVAVLSIFWRALLTTKNRTNNRTEEDSQKLEETLASMKADIIANRCSTKIYFTPFFGEPPYYDLSGPVVYSIERSIGGQDIRFFDEPHRFFATFKLPFMYFHIFDDGWSAAEIAKSTEFATGSLTLAHIKEIPDVLKHYLQHLHDSFVASIPSMDEKNLEQIRKDVAKNNTISGSDKSRRRSEL